jgi:hypothetical protein
MWISFFCYLENNRGKVNWRACFESVYVLHQLPFPEYHNDKNQTGFRLFRVGSDA